MAEPAVLVRVGHRDAEHGSRGLQILEEAISRRFLLSVPLREHEKPDEVGVFSVGRKVLGHCIRPRCVGAKPGARLLAERLEEGEKQVGVRGAKTMKAHRAEGC